MNEQEIMSELISGGLRVHKAVVEIFQAVLTIIIVFMSMVISVFDIVIGFMMMWKAYISFVRLFLEQFQKKEKERRVWLCQIEEKANIG
jgi:hypothetical protein